MGTEKEIMMILKVVVGALWLLATAFYMSANGDLFFAEKIREIAGVGKLGQAVIATYVSTQLWVLTITVLFLKRVPPGGSNGSLGAISPSIFCFLHKSLKKGMGRILGGSGEKVIYNVHILEIRKYLTYSKRENEEM
ncbi:MAG: hypothetical protein PHY14_01890 [Candidatus Gracilibacteria bacterium]|nr:hypothetical protein [Candidatus Gracilibacteria bacterium]